MENKERNTYKRFFRTITRIPNWPQGYSTPFRKKDREPEVVHVTHEARKKAALKMENRFTDYINRANVKMRAKSTLRKGTFDNTGIRNFDPTNLMIAGKPLHPQVPDKSGGKESKDNHFSNYIKRARMKIRSSSSIKDRME